LEFFCSNIIRLFNDAGLNIETLETFSALLFIICQFMVFILLNNKCTTTHSAWYRFGAPFLCLVNTIKTIQDTTSGNSELPLLPEFLVHMLTALSIDFRLHGAIFFARLHTLLDDTEANKTITSEFCMNEEIENRENTEDLENPPALPPAGFPAA